MTTTVKERPILFNGEMVRAILEGRKTQTRRVVKPKALKHAQQFTNTDCEGLRVISECGGVFDNGKLNIQCPYGKPGDILWVRETWSGVSDLDKTGLLPKRPYKQWPDKVILGGREVSADWIIYGADGHFDWCDDDGFLTSKSHWKPSIHMPRWASRITLLITDVRVERLQDIKYDDAIAEGMLQKWICISPALGSYAHDNDVLDDFQRLWESINGTGSWSANPWVWVIEFKRVEE